jgi:hypothetical protein
MRSKLIPVGCNEMLGSPCDVSFQRELWLCRASLHSPRLSSNAKRPNAAITRRTLTASCDKLTMRDKLHPVGCIGMLGSPYDMMIQAAHLLYSLRHDQLDSL